MKTRLFLSFFFIFLIALLLPLFISWELYPFVETLKHENIKSFILTLICGIFLSAFILSYYISKRFSSTLQMVRKLIDNTAQHSLQNASVLLPRPELQDLTSAMSELSDRISNQMRLIVTQKTELESIINSISAGVMVLDMRGNISKINSAFFELLPDYFRGDISQYIGKHTIEIFRDPDLDLALQKVIDLEMPYHSIQLKIRGKIFQINIVMPMKQENIRQEVQFILLFHDITPMVKLIDIKRDLIANVSHELRTPLTAIQGYAETIHDFFEEDEYDKENIQSFLNVIIKNTQHLDRIVKDLLSLSLLENEEEHEKDIYSSLKIAYETALSECFMLFEEKNINIINLLDKEACLAIDTDRLSQVFRNLLENALRYAPENSSIVLHSECDNTLCRISVQDFGKGIPQEDINRVFERFYRVEKHRTSNGISSTGLGLSLCKHIVEKYKGSIYALYRAKSLIETSNSVGATICFDIPLYKKNI